jgi:hypothetical protein
MKVVEMRVLILGSLQSLGEDVNQNFEVICR